MTEPQGTLVHGFAVPGETEAACVANLRTHQTQLDADGCMVGVSRQALDETLAIYDGLLAVLEAAERQLRPLSGRSRNADLHKVICAALAKATPASSVGTTEADSSKVGG